MGPPASFASLVENAKNGVKPDALEDQQPQSDAKEEIKPTEIKEVDPDA